MDSVASRVMKNLVRDESKRRHLDIMIDRGETTLSSITEMINTTPQPLSPPPPPPPPHPLESPFHGDRDISIHKHLDVKVSNDTDSEPINIKRKRKIINLLYLQCLRERKKYHSRYKSTKSFDTACDIITAVLNSASISMSVSSITYPYLIFGSAISTAMAMMIYGVTISQLDSVARDIIARMHVNNQSSDQYSLFLESINLRLDMIDDSKII
jgi:hypothetical protein